ncbi:hypothetical protein MD484_g2836, partial [Candolleomyces efflorescens]
METMDDPTEIKNQHNFAHAHVLTQGDAQFNSVAGNMSVYENCTFLRAEDGKDRVSEDKLFQRICKWLGDISFNSIFSESLSKGTEGTGMWFIKSKAFQRWAKGDLQILWGTGKRKTILSSIVIDHLRTTFDKRKQPPVIFAYCRYTEKYSATQILSSWVKQFLQRDRLTMQRISEHFLSDEEPRLTNRQLLQFLSAIASAYERSFIVLDGLDEAEENDRQQLLDGISSLPSNMHTLIMSRPMKSFEYLVPRAEFLDIQAHNKDIGRFVETRIGEIPTLRAVLQGKDAAKDQLYAAIKKKSNGMFLVARLQVEALRDCINVKSLLAALEELPTGVNDLYQHTLDRIEAQGPQRALLAKRTFLWMAHAFTLLSIRELQEALAVNLELEAFDEDSIVTKELIHDVCSGLIYLEGDFIARFIHYTALDFLKEKCSSWFQRPHAILSSSCVVYLSSQRSSFQDLARYAGVNWGSHARHDFEEESGLPPTVSKYLIKVSNHAWRGVTVHEWLADQWVTPEQISSGHLAAFLGLKSYLQDHVELSTVTPTNRFTFLHVAAMGGHVDTAQAIIRKWPALTPHDLSSKGKTPFMLAAGYGHTSMLEFFLSISSNKQHLLNCRASCGCTALACAVLKNQQSAIRFLVSLSGIDINVAACRTGYTPLAWAARAEDTIVVSRLLSNPSLDINFHNPLSGHTALFSACYQNNDHIVKLFISRPDLDINARSRCGCTPLALSIHHGRSRDIISLLLSHPHINLHTRCQDSGEALGFSRHSPSDWIKRFTLTHPRLFENATHADIQLCLQRAAELGVESAVRNIISRVLAPENLRPAATVLVKAAKAGHLSIVEMLLEYADVNAKDNSGSTALAEAVTSGDVGLTTLLLSREDILINKGPHPVLVTASRQGYASIVQLLLHHRNTDVNVQDRGGQVALTCAIDMQHWDVVDMLLAVPTIDVNRGSSPALVKACSNGHENLVERLLEREGIDVNVEDAKGWSPLTCAAFIGHYSICNSLLGRPELRLTGWSVPPLVQAAAGGSEAVVRLLLSRIPIHSLNDVHVDGGNAVTALSIASRYGLSEIVKLLVCRPEVDVNLGRPTPLMQACIGGHVAIVRLLLSHYGEALDVNVRDERHSMATALWYACYGSWGRCPEGITEEIVLLLLERSDLNIYIGVEPEPEHRRPGIGSSPVNDSDSDSDDDSVNGEELGPDKDLRNLSPSSLHLDDERWRLSTPLHAACIKCPRAAELLLASPGIDATQVNACGETALMVILHWPHPRTSNLVDHLLSRSGPLDSAGGLSLLSACVSSLIRPFRLEEEEEFIIDVMKRIVLTLDQRLDINQYHAGTTALSAALLNGKGSAAVTYLLSLPTIDPNCGTPRPVIQASVSGNSTALAMLLRHPKTDPNVLSERGYTALGEVLISNGLFSAQAIIVEFLASWPSVNVNAGKHTPLAIAVFNGLTASAELLLRRPDTDVNCRVPRRPPNVFHSRETTPPANQLEHCNAVPPSYVWPASCLAEQHIAHDPLRRRFRAKAQNPRIEDLDVCDAGCDPILVFCTKFGFPEIAEKLLLQDGIDVNASGSCGCTALTWATQLCKGTIINTLLERDDTAIDVRCFHHGHTALLAAAHQMKFQLVHKLLTHPRSHEINANAFAACGCNVFVSASRSGDEDTVRSILSLVDWREYPNVQDCKFGRTALLWASYFGHNSLVQLFLCQQEVAVDHRDRQGHTALMLAASGGHEDVVRSLLSSSRVSNVHVCNWNGDTALTLAEWYGHKNIAKLLGLIPGTIAVMSEERERGQGASDIDVAVGPAEHGLVLNTLKPLGETLVSCVTFSFREVPIRSIFLFLFFISILSSAFLYFALRIDAGYDMLAGFWKFEMYSVLTRILPCMFFARCLPL